MKKLFVFIVALFVSFGAFATDNPNILGTYGEWTAYVFRNQGQKICYMTTMPTKSQGKYTRRGDVFLYVTHHPADKKFDVVDAVAGYTYRKGSNPTITIDKNKSITLRPVEDTAWSKDSPTDTKLVKQMKKGNTAVLKGTSTRGTLTTDTFSLTGFSKAYAEIQKACGRE